MRAVVQRVLHASVVVDGNTVSSIGRGLVALVGIGKDDGPRDSAYITSKLLSLRLFPKQINAVEQPWKASVEDIEGELLCVSQFTLLAVTAKGSKPDFHRAMPMYDDLLRKLGEAYRPDRIKDGEFGAMMNVSLCNEGPVTIILDSREPSAHADPAPADRERADLQRRKAEEKQKRSEELAERTRANAAAKAARQAAFEQSPQTGS